MQCYDTANRLADELRQSEEYREFHRLKPLVMADDCDAGMIREFKRLQGKLQVLALSGDTPEAEDTQRFTALSALLYQRHDIADYLLAEMRLQKLVGDLLQIVTNASGLDFGLPGM